MPIVQKVPPPLAPDPIPHEFAHEEAIERLLALGLTLAEIQTEEEQVAALHAIALLRALPETCFHSCTYVCSCPATAASRTCLAALSRAQLEGLQPGADPMWQPDHLDRTNHPLGLAPEYARWLGWRTAHR